MLRKNATVCEKRGNVEMTISEFAKSHNVESGAVRMYLLRHKEEFGNHVDNTKKMVELDETAVKMLEEQYPLPKPVTIINGIPEEEHRKLLEEYNEALKQIARLQATAAEQAQKIASAEAKQLLLEEKERQLESQARLLSNVREELKESRATADALHQRKYETDLENVELQGKTEQLQEELERLRNELNQEKSKGLLKKLFGK